MKSSASLKIVEYDVFISTMPISRQTAVMVESMIDMVTMSTSGFWVMVRTLGDAADQKIAVLIHFHGWPGRSTVTETGSSMTAGPGDRVAVAQLRAVVDRCLVAAVVEHDRARRHGLWLSLRLADGGEVGLLGERDDGRLDGDHLDHLARNVEAEAREMHVVERLPDLGRRLVGEGIEGDRDLQLVVLAEIAHLQRAVDLDVLHVPLRLQLGDAGLDQRAHDLRRAGLIEALGRHLHRVAARRRARRVRMKPKAENWPG